MHHHYNIASPTLFGTNVSSLSSHPLHDGIWADRFSLAGVAAAQTGADLVGFGFGILGRGLAEFFRQRDALIGGSMDWCVGLLSECGSGVRVFARRVHMLVLATVLK